MNGCVQWNTAYDEKKSTAREIRVAVKVIVEGPVYGEKMPLGGFITGTLAKQCHLRTGLVQGGGSVVLSSRPRRHSISLNGTIIFFFSLFIHSVFLINS